MLDTVGEVACAVVVIGGVQIVPFAVGAIVLEVVIVVILVGDPRLGLGWRPLNTSKGSLDVELFVFRLVFIFLGW